MPFTARRIDLEITILNELSQTERNIIYHLYVETEKLIQMNLFAK